MKKQDNLFSCLLVLSDHKDNNKKICSTVVVAYINTMKPTYDFNFDLYQAVKCMDWLHISIEFEISCQLKNPPFD